MRLLSLLWLAAAVTCSEPLALEHSGKASFAPTAFIADVRGHGRPIILIPGLGCPGAVWNDLTARLDGYQTHTLTLAGFAGQPAIDRPVVAAARGELARYIHDRGLDHPVIVGHSLGGYLAYWLAATEPELVGPVIVVDAGAALGTDDRDDNRDAAAQARAAWADASDAQFTQQIRASFSAMSVAPSRLRSTIDAVERSDRRAMGDAVYEMFTHDLRPLLRQIRAPVLVVLADGELQSDYRAHARAIPRHQVVVLPHTKHFVFVDDPDAFVATVERFLNTPAQVSSR